MPEENNIEEIKNDQEQESQNDEFALLNNEDLMRFEEQIKVKNEIKPLYTGYVYDMKENFAKTRFNTTKDMAYDEEGLVFNSFLQTAANYAAQLAVNSEFLVTIASRVNFLAPAKVGDIISFEARAFFNESKKREVKVSGFINDIRVIECSFSIIILEEHIFKLQKKQLEKQARESKNSHANENK